MKRTGLLFLSFFLAVGLWVGTPDLAKADFVLSETGAPSISVTGTEMQGSVAINSIVDGKSLVGTLSFNAGLAGTVTPYVNAEFVTAGSSLILSGTWGGGPVTTLLSGVFTSGNILMSSTPLEIAILNSNFQGALDPAFAHALAYSSTLDGSLSSFSLWYVGGILGDTSQVEVVTNPVPLPSTLPLLAPVLLGLLGMRKRIKR